MKYIFRFYLNEDKTRFFEQKVEVNESCSLGSALSVWEKQYLDATIQKVVRV